MHLQLSAESKYHYMYLSILHNMYTADTLEEEEICLVSTSKVGLKMFQNGMNILMFSFTGILVRIGNCACLVFSTCKRLSPIHVYVYSIYLHHLY